MSARKWPRVLAVTRYAASFFVGAGVASTVAGSLQDGVFLTVFFALLWNDYMERNL